MLLTAPGLITDSSPIPPFRPDGRNAQITFCFDEPGSKIIEFIADLLMPKTSKLADEENKWYIDYGVNRFSLNKAWKYYRWENSGSTQTSHIFFLSLSESICTYALSPKFFNTLTSLGMILMSEACGSTEKFLLRIPLLQDVRNGEGARG